MPPVTGNRGGTGFLYFPERAPAVATYSNVAPNNPGYNENSADVVRRNEVVENEALFQPIAKKGPSKNKKNGLAPVNPRSRSAMEMIDAESSAQTSNLEVRVRDDQIKVLTEANMELAAKLQLLEEAMVGADSIMERRTEMMRALAEENQDLLAMVEQAESNPQRNQQYSQPTPKHSPFQAWPEKSLVGSGYQGDEYIMDTIDDVFQNVQRNTQQRSSIMPNVQQARIAIENGVQRLQRHRPLIGQEELAMAMGAMNYDNGEGQVEMRDIIGQIEGLDREIFDGPRATRKQVEKAVPLQVINEKEVVRLRVETHALRMFKLKCNEEITAKVQEMQRMSQDLSRLKKKLAETEASKNDLAEDVRLHEEEVRLMTDQYAMMTNRYHDEEEFRVRLAEDLRANQAKIKILEEEAFIMRTRNSAVVNKWVKARHRAVEHELKEQLNDVSALLTDEENLRAKAEENMQRKQLELELMRERHYCLLNDLAASQEETKQSRKAREDASEKQKAAEHRLQLAREDVVASEAKADALREQITDMQTEHEELHKMKDKMKDKMMELEKEIVDLKKTLQQIYAKHAEQLRKSTAEWEEKTTILKQYIKSKDEENRDLSGSSAELLKQNQLNSVRIVEYEKSVASKVEEIKKMKQDNETQIAELKQTEQTKQDVLKMYSRTKDAELQACQELLEKKTLAFNKEELARQKKDIMYDSQVKEDEKLTRRYQSLQNGYDREMSSRERLEQTMLEQERDLRSETQKIDQQHRKKFQELAEKEMDTLHKLMFEMAAREDAEMALIHKQEEIFELRARVTIVQEAKDEADKLQSLVDEESRQLHVRVRELLVALENSQKLAAAADERAQKAEALAGTEVMAVRSEANMVLEAKLAELRALEEELKKAQDEIMAMTIAMENERLQTAKDLAYRDDEIGKLRSENERMDFEISENESTIQKATEDADIALREVQALRERAPETLSSLKDEKIRNLDALEKSQAARLKKAEDARVLATTEQRAEEKKVRDLKIELMEVQNQLEQFKREFLSKEQMKLQAKEREGTKAADGKAGGAFTLITDPVDRKDLAAAEEKLAEIQAELLDLDKQLRVEERLKIKAQTELKERERELHKFLTERDNELKELVEEGMLKTVSSQNAELEKEKERNERRQKRLKEKTQDVAKVELSKATTAEEAAKAADKYSEEDKEKFKKLFDLVRYNKYKDVEKMLQAGCPVDWRDPNGYTPLMVACQNGLKRIVKSIMRFNCDLNCKNQRGQTACHLANMYEHGDLMEYLISKGARDDILNDAGKTCHEATK